jgi:hypothetical protein
MSGKAVPGARKRGPEAGLSDGLSWRRDPCDEIFTTLSTKLETTARADCSTSLTKGGRIFVYFRNSTM